MRELTKSMLSFSWVMPLLGVRQMMNLMAPDDWTEPTAKATATFDAVTEATRNQLSGVFADSFEAGDGVQRGMVDMMFGFLTLEGLNPNKMMKTSSDLLQRSAKAVGEVMPDCDSCR